MDFISYYLLEKNGNTVTAYHGSPYKFNEFGYDRLGEHGQLGAEDAFFFTLDRKSAKYFALQFSGDYYDDLEKARERYEEYTDKEFREIYDNMTDEDWEQLMDYLDRTGSNFNRYNMDFDKFKDLITVAEKFEPQIIEEVDVIKEVVDVKKKYDERYNVSVKNIESKYKDQVGYLYTVEIKADRIDEVDGEKIGINWERKDYLDRVEEEGYDAVIIRNADTGGPITDEIAVFDKNNIKIIDIEEVEP